MTSETERLHGKEEERCPECGKFEDECDKTFHTKDPCPSSECPECRAMELGDHGRFCSDCCEPLEAI